MSGQKISRIGSVAIALIYLIVVWCRTGISGAEAVLLLVAAPLFMIWCSDTIGSFTLPAEYHSIDKPTPGWLIAGFGWLFLLFPAVWWFFIR
ncbi:MAG: hypothetical protein ABFD49_10890 [Armatimonadota bacterium]|nr:hypothetical protein [bacterium]